MSGIRVLNIPIGTTEKDIKIYFSNPKNGGSRLKQIYFPLQGNDAVLFYHDEKVTARSFTKSGILQFKGNTVIVRGLPRKVFNKVTVELDQQMTQYLDENPSYLDEIQFDGDLEMTFDAETMNYIMSGDWYQVEWALTYLDNMCGDAQINQNSKTTKAERHKPADETSLFEDKSGLNVKKDIGHKYGVDEFQSRGPNMDVKGFDIGSSIKSMPVSENKIGGRLLDNEAKVYHENIQKKPSQYNDTGALSNITKFSSSATYTKTSRDKDVTNLFSAGYKPGMKSLFSQRGKTSSNAGNRDRTKNPYGFGSDFGQEATGRSKLAKEFSDYGGSVGDDDWNDPENATYLENIFQQPGQRRFSNRQQGMSVSHADFSDIPLKLDINVEAVRVLVTLGDLIEETTDAIVNPCSTDLANTYGISKAIAIAAGKNLQEECRRYISKKGHMVFGDVIHTCAGGILKKRVGFVVHAAGPTWRNDQSDQSTHILTCTYLNCFQYANKHLWLRSISLPLISAGFNGCPLDASVQAFYDALLLHTIDDTQSRHLQEIHLVSNDPDSTCAIIVVLNSLIDQDQAQSKKAAIERYQNNCAQFEFSANQFDMFVDRQEIESSESETDETQEEADDDEKNIESRMRNLKEIKDASDVNVDDIIDVKSVPTGKDDVTTYSSEDFTGEAARHKQTEDGDTSDDDSSDYRDKDQVEPKSEITPEDDEVPMGVVNMSGEEMFEPQKKDKDQATGIDMKRSIQQKEETVEKSEYSEDEKDQIYHENEEDKFVHKEPIVENASEDVEKKTSSKFSESTV